MPRCGGTARPAGKGCAWPNARSTCRCWASCGTTRSLNKDNCLLDDVDAAVEEVKQFADLGGRTVVDPTNRNIGRNPKALVEISERTGLNIVMGAGYYLEGAHPPEVKAMTATDICDQIVQEAAEGVDGHRHSHRPDWGDRHQRRLHAGGGESPAWRRPGVGPHRLAAVGPPAGMGAPCPSGPGRGGKRRLRGVAGDPVPHESELLPTRHTNGAWPAAAPMLEYDMISMDFFYADQQAQCPSEEDNATAIRDLINDGWIDRVLMSQDVFLKMMLTRYGGFGYAFILRHFVPRLRRHGVSDAQIHHMLVDNPKHIFRAAMAGNTQG